MIVLKISNSSEVVAGKIGRFLERLTPGGFDETTVEDIVLQKLVENLREEGIRGEVAAVKGMDFHATELVMKDSMHVRKHQVF